MIGVLWFETEKRQEKAEEEIRMKESISLKNSRKSVLNVVFWLYIAVMLRITVFRSGFGFDHLLSNGRINFTLFEEYIPILARGDWFIFIYLFVGNIIWFLPFGMYFQATGKGKNLRTVVLYGFLFSLTIESLQYVFGTGCSELDDLVLNSFGAWIGAILMKGRSAACGRIHEKRKAGRHEKT